MRNLYIQYHTQTGIFYTKLPNPVKKLEPKGDRITRSADGTAELVLGGVSQKIRRDSVWMQAAEQLRGYQISSDMFVMYITAYSQSRMYYNTLKSPHLMYQCQSRSQETYLQSYDEVEEDFLKVVEDNGELLGFEYPFTELQLRNAANYTIGINGAQFGGVFVSCVADRYDLGLAGYRHPVRTMEAVREFCLNRRQYMVQWGKDRVRSLFDLTEQLINVTKEW